MQERCRLRTRSSPDRFRRSTTRIWCLSSSRHLHRIWRVGSQKRLPRRFSKQQPEPASSRARLPRFSEDSARYTVSDLNQPMLDRAASRQGADDRIVWRQADALQLPFEDDSFDAVCCQFGVMFFPDRIAGYREALRVLKPGGHFLFNVWDRIEHNDFARIVTETAGHHFPQPTRRCSWPERRTAITTSRGSTPTCARPAFRPCRDRDPSRDEQRSERPRSCGRLLPGHARCATNRSARSGGPGKVTDSAAAAIAKEHGEGPVRARSGGMSLLRALVLRPSSSRRRRSFHKCSCNLYRP
jgi:SAM-dependent methyltransferase